METTNQQQEKQKKISPFPVRLNQEERDKLDILANHYGKSRTDVVRWLIMREVIGDAE